jgi:Tfp pilus assembly protein PilF
MRQRLAPILLASLAALPVVADVVHLRNGGRVEGQVTDLGDSIELDTGRGRFRISKGDIDRIEPKAWTPAPRREEGAPVPPPSDPPAPRRLGEAYTHPFIGFTLRPPLGWKAGEPVKAAVVSFYGPPDKFYVPRLDVVHVRLEGGSTFEEFLKVWKDKHAKEFPGWTAVEEGPTGIHGALGTRFVATLGEGLMPLKNLSVALRGGDRVFVLSFTTGRGFFDRYTPVVERSLRTFRILPESTLDEAQRRAFQARYQAAVEHLQAKRRAEAIAGFRACAEVLPALPDVHVALGDLYAETGREDEAVAAYRKVIALDPDHADAHYNLGTLLLRRSKNQDDEAIRMLRKAAALDPDHERAHINLGVALLSRKAWAEARAVLERGCLLDPGSAVAHYALGRVYEQLKELQRAEREYRDVLQIDPNHGEAKEALGRVQRR